MQKSPLQYKKAVQPGERAHSAKLTLVSKSSSTAIKSPSAVPTAELSGLIEYWLKDGYREGHKQTTLELRRTLLGRLLWFLEESNFTHCDHEEFGQFLDYLHSAHLDGGRWSRSEQPYSKALSSATISSYFHHIRTFFNWLVEEDLLERSPMEKMKPPINRADQIQPFTLDQVAALIEAAQRTKYPHRDEAIVRFLFDTGVRVSELCAMKMEKVDMAEGQVRILGKGGKYRAVCFGRKTARALRAYWKLDGRTPDQPVFLSERGENAGSQFTRWGVSQVIERIGEKANIDSVRCSPHTFRHTFAVQFIINGGSQFALKTLLGHSSIQTTNRYVALAGADIKTQHNTYGPGDRL